MKNKNQNKKRRFTFNAIDALIILIIIAIIALTVYAFILDKDFSGDSLNSDESASEENSGNEAKTVSDYAPCLITEKAECRL